MDLYVTLNLINVKHSRTRAAEAARILDYEIGRSASEVCFRVGFIVFSHMHTYKLKIRHVPRESWLFYDPRRGLLYVTTEQ